MKLPLPNEVKASARRIFSTDDGMKVLKYLTWYTHADKAEFCNDPRADAYWQGRRSAVLEIRRLMEEDEND